MLELALRVANGEPMWGMETKQGTVLYYCLEDTFQRIQQRLYATAAFTLDVYGHVTEKMKRESAARMEAFIQAVNA